MSLPQGWTATGWQAESGQAWVYQVRRQGELGGQLYALKRLKNPSRKARFVRETEAMDRLRREHGAAVPEIVAHDLEAERPWFVMPWYDAGSLEDAVSDGRFRSDITAGLDRLVALAEILADVHVAGVAHRDLKPANVLVGDEELALTDFGLCLDLENESFRLTQADEAIGSRLYIAPENEGGINLEIDQRPADSYAFGKLAWALLAGRQPLPRERVVEPDHRLAVVLSDSRLAPLDALFRDLLARDPRARLTDWAVVIRELRALGRLLAGVEETVPRDASDGAAVIARRLRDSAAVQDSLERRGEQERREVWSARLIRQLHESARIVEPSLRPLSQELGDLLSIGATSGGPPSRDQLTESGLELPEEFTHLLPGASATEAAVCFVIHSPRSIESFPTIVVRVWPFFDGERVWIARLPMVCPVHGRERVATFLAPWLFRLEGPFPAFRQATIDEAVGIVEESARLFVSLAEEYLTIVDAGDDPADPEAWEAREVTPAETVAAAPAARGDTHAPDLRSFGITPSVVEMADAPVDIVCRARIVDDLAGVAGADFASSPSQARFRSPAGQLGDVLFTDMTRVSGDALDGVYEANLTLPSQAERGLWEVEYDESYEGSHHPAVR